MAAVILASGRRAERVVGPSAALSLTPIENAAGTPADLRRLRLQVADSLAGLCGQLPEVVAQHLLVGRFLTPEEAVAYGLADRVEA